MRNNEYAEWWCGLLRPISMIPYENNISIFKILEKTWSAMMHVMLIFLNKVDVALWVFIYLFIIIIISYLNKVKAPSCSQLFAAANNSPPFHF